MHAGKSGRAKPRYFQYALREQQDESAADERGDEDYH
jgi:hypothetical protein